MTPATIAIIAQFAIQYGIPAAQDLIALFKNQNATIADVEAMFAKVLTYEQYNIPVLTPPVKPV